MRKLPILLTSSLCLLYACSGVPSGVIPPDKMSKLMADVHIAEAVLDMNRSTYSNDSLRQTMKQSVFARYKVTSAEFDSSLSWYGHHIEKYMEVYDGTIDILERRLTETGNRLAADASLSIAGDSVDVWPGARYIRIGAKAPSNTVVFDYSRDHNWERGDMYTWRGKFFNTYGDSEWLIGIDYADGSSEWHNERLSGDGWREMKVQTDSLRDPVRIYGYMLMKYRPGTEVVVDSLQMVRRRLNPESYRRSYFISLRKFNEPVEIPDSL
ncbi:MAG: DUF4296 domain-containing protein [Muribaculaceae bacterium]|nr:DUF4296 domain-containing protein [Muribaculaceae bacterium]